MKTIVVINAPDCGGKSSLFRILMQRQWQLLAVPRLVDICEGSCEFAHGTPFIYLNESKLPMLAAIRKAIGNKDYLVTEGHLPVPRIGAECRGKYNLLNVWLVTSPWLIKIRRRCRLLASGWTTEDDIEKHIAYIRPQYQKPDQASTLETTVKNCEAVGASLLLLNANDFPLMPVSLETARQIVSDEQAPLIEEKLGYQRAVRFGEEWYGDQDYIEVQKERFDRVLPEDLSGKIVLDVGACNGAFAFEAINRGALYAMAVDSVQKRINTMKMLRDAFRFPVTTLQMDIKQDAIPPLQVYRLCIRQPIRYGLTLLSNILHHIKNPIGFLRSTLLISDAVVIETPPVAGKRWPTWIYDVAKQGGFVVESEEAATVRPEQRRMFKLKRVSG